MNSTKDGTRFLAAILSKQGDLGVLANDLLGAIRGGLSIDELRVLLESEDPELVRVGVWIQSELGASGRPLVQFLPRLLRHELKYVRFFAIDAVLGCATPDDGALIAEALLLVHDVESSVRWKVIDFLARMPLQELRAAEAFLLGTGPESDVARALQRFLNDESGHEAEAMLENDAAELRRFGLALAMRQKNRKALELAAKSADDEIREIAEGTLKRRS